jgi:hypothetical protein
MPTIFLWKEWRKNDGDSLPIHVRGTDKSRVFASGYAMTRAPPKLLRYASAKPDHFAAHADPQIEAVLP